MDSVEDEILAMASRCFASQNTCGSSEIVNGASALSWLPVLVWEEASVVRVSHWGRSDYAQQAENCRYFDMGVRGYAVRQHSLGSLAGVVRVGRPRVPSVQEKSRQQVKSRGSRLLRAVLA